MRYKTRQRNSCIAGYHNYTFTSGKVSKDQHVFIATLFYWNTEPISSLDRCFLSHFNIIHGRIRKCSNYHGRKSQSPGKTCQLWATETVNGSGWLFEPIPHVQSSQEPPSYPLHYWVSTQRLLNKYFGQNKTIKSSINFTISWWTGDF